MHVFRLSQPINKVELDVVEDLAVCRVSIGVLVQIRVLL